MEDGGNVKRRIEEKGQRRAMGGREAVRCL